MSTKKKTSGAPERETIALGLLRPERNDSKLKRKKYYQSLLIMKKSQTAIVNLTCPILTKEELDKVMSIAKKLDIDGGELLRRALFEFVERNS